MSDEISGEWLSARDKYPPRHQVSKENNRPVACKTRIKTIFKKDHPPNVYVSFSNTPPPPSTLLDLQRKKQSKIDLFFKPAQQEKEKNQKVPKLRPIKRLGKSKKQCCDLNNEFIQEAATNMEEKTSLEDSEVVFANENNKPADDKFDISGPQVIDEESFSNENSSSADDDYAFSPIIYVNSQEKCGTSPPLKRRKVSHDSEVDLNCHTGVEARQSLSLHLKDDKRILCDKMGRKFTTPEIKNVNYHETQFLSGSMLDNFTSQELSEIPPFTFNQVTKAPIDNSLHSELRLKTLAGVDSESVGFTQWVEKQGEKCKRIQNEIQSSENRGLLIDKNPYGKAKAIT